MSRVRLNFVIGSAVEDRLGRYCAVTGRRMAGVVRQVVMELLDGDLPFPSSGEEEESARRTSVLLEEMVLARLDETARAHHVTKARLVGGLIESFLGRRAVKSDVSEYRAVLEEMVLSWRDGQHERFTRALTSASELLDCEGGVGGSRS